MPTPRSYRLAADRAATWADLPGAAALLADCAVNPPRRVHHRDVYAITADHWSEYSRRDPRVQALRRLWEEAFEIAEAHGIDTGPVLDLTPDKAIENALEAALSARVERPISERKAA